MSNYVIVSVRMDKTRHRELESICEKMERSKSWALNKAYDMWAESKKEKKGEAA